MDKSTSRDRDKGRKYKAGSVKRQEKAEEMERVKKLPKITQWLTYTTVSDCEQSQTHTESGPSLNKVVYMMPETQYSITETPTAPETSGEAIASTEPIVVLETEHEQNKVTTGSDHDTEQSQNLQSQTAEYRGVQVSVKQEEEVKVSTGTEHGFENDLGLWPRKISEEMRDYWLKRGSTDCQHCHGDFKESAVKELDRTRHCTKTLFTRTHSLSGQKIDLRWLCYSKTTGRVYCFPCKLMSDVDSSFTTGFNSWKNARHFIECHSRSDQHRKALVDTISRKTSGARVDSNLIQQYETECEYWQAVLKRCVDTLKLLCERGLALRGKDEVIGSPHNGNYLGILELLSTYDTFLAAHIKKHANKGSGHTSYLSHVISEELIGIMAKKVMCSITDEVKAAKYFSISVDSTPDISHMDQLTFTIRYVMPTTGPIERFLQFIPMLRHTGRDIARTVLDSLKEKNIPISNCRGQSYDNASNMSGKYQGVQQIIKQECSEAKYMPCMAHSLNLVGKCAAESCSAAVSLFALIQKIYSFLVASTYRWRRHCEVLETNKELKLKVDKKLSDTRWSARADAVAALSRAHKENITVLEELSTDHNQPPETRVEASGLLKGLKEIETVILLEVWDTVLERFQSTSIQLQKSGLSLNTAVALLESLLHFVEDLRSQFDDFEAKAMAKCDVKGNAAYKDDMQRIRKRKRHHDEIDSAEEVTLTGRDKFRATAFLPIIDKLCVALRQRLGAYSDLRERFGFLSEISNKTTTELKVAAEKLVSSYPQDLEARLETELLQFAHLMKSIPNDSSESVHSSGRARTAISPELEMYNMIHKHDLIETFTNVEIVLRLYLCMFVTNCTGERSFSKMKIIKNYLRNTMGQERLSSLTLLSIEHEKLRELDFADVIKEFASQKARKKPFSSISKSS